MQKFTVSQEEIFFGIVAGDGTRTSIIRKQPSRAELKQLWQEYHDLFAGQCECGATNYIYSHIITRRRIFRGVKTSVVAYICPECGRRSTLGANYQKAQKRVEVLDRLAHD